MKRVIVRYKGKEDTAQLIIECIQLTRSNKSEFPPIIQHRVYENIRKFLQTSQACTYLTADMNSKQ
jgi:hypothetical protein